MKIFITGATGFVGYHLTKHFKERGHEVFAMARPTSDIKKLKELDVKIVFATLKAPESIKGEVDSVDVLIHCAGAIKALSNAEYYEVNGIGTKTIVNFFVENFPDLKKVIYISSIAAQGPSSGKYPKPETEPPMPISVYGESKKMGEGFVLQARDRVTCGIVRPTIIFGPHDFGMLPFFKAVKTGIIPVSGLLNSYITMIYIDDLVNAISLMVENSFPTGSIFPIDNGEIITQKELGLKVAKILGKKGIVLRFPILFLLGLSYFTSIAGKIFNKSFMFNPDKVKEMAGKYWICGYENLKKTFGFKPTVTIEEGLKKTLNWYIKNNLL